MREQVTVCWAPECAEPVQQGPRGRPQRYHTNACRQRALRRNGMVAPTEPFPPLLPDAPVASTVEVPHTAVPPELGATAHAETTVAPRPKPRRRVKRAQGSSGESVPAAEDEPSSPAPAQATQLHVVVTEDSTVPVVIKVHPLVAAYKRDLARIGQTDTREGLQVQELAEKLVSAATSPAAGASLSRELKALMDGLEQNTPEKMAERDPSLLIRERTLAKLRSVDAAS